MDNFKYHMYFLIHRILKVLFVWVKILFHLNWSRVLLFKLRLHYNELAQRTATVWRYLTFGDIRCYTLKKSDEFDHWGLTYWIENEFQTTPERTHNVLVANDKRVSTTPQRTPNVLRVLAACPLRTLCEQCAYKLWDLIMSGWVWGSSFDLKYQPYIFITWTSPYSNRFYLRPVVFFYLIYYQSP